MRDTIDCPYCHEEQSNIDFSEMYDEDELYQEECWSCDKKFAVRVHQSFWYDAEEVDCWNDEPHDWSPWHPHHPKADYTQIFETRYCYNCGEREQEYHDVDDSENHQRIIKMYKEVEERRNV